MKVLLIEDSPEIVNGVSLTFKLRWPDAIVISKATNSQTDAYSGFSGTDLDRELRQRNINRLFVGGLATDYCVLNTVKDGLALGYQVMLLNDASRAVNVKPDDGDRAVAEMLRLGAISTTLAGTS